MICNRVKKKRKNLQSPIVQSSIAIESDDLLALKRCVTKRRPRWSGAGRCGAALARSADSSPCRPTCIASGAAWCRSWRRASTSRHLRRRGAGSRPAQVDYRCGAMRSPHAGPGPRGSLLVGVRLPSAAAALGSQSWPCTIWPGISSRSGGSPATPLPAVVLVVSGGHTSLHLVPAAGRLSAARAHARRRGRGGVDKVAKLLGWLSRWPAIDRLAGEATKRRDLPRRASPSDRTLLTRAGPTEFSFSG